MGITAEERDRVARHITSASDADVRAFLEGSAAYHRGEPGTLEASDAYSRDMMTRVAWRTGWMVADREHVAAPPHLVCDLAVKVPIRTDAGWAELWVWADRVPRLDPDAEAVVLVTKQPNPAKNGVYLVRRDGSHRRAPAMSEGSTVWPGTPIHAKGSVMEEDGETKIDPGHAVFVVEPQR
jgi:hypothetical protein